MKYLIDVDINLTLQDMEIDIPEDGPFDRDAIAEDALNLWLKMGSIKKVEHIKYGSAEAVELTNWLAQD